MSMFKIFPSTFLENFRERFLGVREVGEIEQKKIRERKEFLPTRTKLKVRVLPQNFVLISYYIT